MRLDVRQRAVVDALCPAGADDKLPWGAYDAGFEEFAENLESTAPPALVWSFRGALFVAVWLTPLMIRRLPPFTRLTPADRERALEALGKFPVYHIRQCLILMKAVVSFCYGADARVRKAVGAPQ